MSQVKKEYFKQIYVEFFYFYKNLVKALPIFID